MAVVRINRLAVQVGAGPTLEQRFASRLRRIEAPGFLGFELLRPTSGTEHYYVITRWESAEAFLAWREGQGYHGDHKHAPPGKQPVAETVGLLEFDSVLRVGLG